MDKRVIFNSFLDRKIFFSKLIENSKFESWKEFLKNNNLSKKTLDCYKSGKRTLPEKLYDSFLMGLIKKDRIYFSNKIRLIDSNQGYVRGGKLAYKKNILSFANGRKKGLSKILELNKKEIFDYTKINLDSDLSYLVGLWIGDGFSSDYKKHYITQFIGHKKELEYYQIVISKYLENTFKLKPKIKEYEDRNYFRLNIYSRDFFNLLIKHIGLPSGRKSHTVLIPNRILLAEKEILFSCIAGIYDAEGNIFMDKRSAYKKPYPRVGLHMVNPGIMNQIKNILDTEGIITSWANKNEIGLRFLVYGEKNIRNFLAKIPIKESEAFREVGVIR